ncbi:MAG: hydrogen peroxide-inducible genes activator, partial [Acidobacteriia bacterium]|nr:hydrogen peroxide-inducible genes activator [Terriglobia bacterium]
GHCLRDQALAFCGGARRDAPAGLGATSLATVMQMVANGYGVTLLPQGKQRLTKSARRCRN